MNKALLPLVLSLGVFAAACNNGGGDASSNSQSAPGDLAGAKIGAPFTLIDQNGGKVRWDDFKGKYRLVYFGYTYCPDVCPLDLQRIMQAFTRFEKADPARAAKVQPILISLDPERDTPAVLKTYVAAFHPRLIGLTGSKEDIAKVAKDFVVVYGKEEGKGTSSYLVSHSRTPYLFGPGGEPIALVPVDDPGTPDEDEGGPDQVFAFLEKWIR
ncbi:Electron transporter [Sphingomonas paucimobilis]|nr:Electron transporter [Sphingomonas paucimobilis]